MKPNDLVTWTGRNGVAHYGILKMLHRADNGEWYGKVEWWRQGAKRPRMLTIRHDKLIVK